MKIRKHLSRLCLLAGVTSTFCYGGVAIAQPIVGGQPTIAADHHMHIESPEGAHRADRFCTKIGRDQCGDLIQSSTALDATKALDAAGIAQGVLLSTAYMAGSPELSEPAVSLARDTRQENDYIVNQARASCGRLAAFISVNPTSPNALDEINFWRLKGGAVGLKLHLANSAFDFNSKQQVERLAAVFKAAALAKFPIVIHLRNRDPNYGGKDVSIFLRDVLPSARGVPVQIAHSGGWGGADRQALSALTAFADAIRHDPQGTSNLYFDMAVMPDMPKKPASKEEIAEYVSLLRQIGPVRFLLASDWVKGTDLKAYYGEMKRRLNLTSAEWRILETNKAPYLNDVHVEKKCRIPE